MEWSKEEINALYEKVMAKAATDSDFRKELRDSTAMREGGREKAPDSFQSKVIKKDPAHAQRRLYCRIWSTGELDENPPECSSRWALLLMPAAGMHVQLRQEWNKGNLRPVKDRQTLIFEKLHVFGLSELRKSAVNKSSGNWMDMIDS